MNPADLERLLDRSLQELPPPRAPGTLVPRVMARVHHWTQRPWYAREWLTWPLGARITSAAAAVALLAGILLASPASGAGDRLAAAIATAAGSLTSDAVADPASIARLAGDTAAQASATTSAAWIVWRVVLTPFVAYAAAIVTLMCVACAVLATALNHLAFGKALPR
jgi:hypothetical protein